MGDFYGKGIPVASGFDLGSPQPIDHRLTKATIAQRNSIPVNILYDGISVYVEETKKDYRWIDGEWVSSESKYEVDPDNFSKVVPIIKGGTGASKVDEARNNLGVPPTNHASDTEVYGLASVNNYGHAKSSNTDPLMDGVADKGKNISEFARSDHRHPTDTTRASVQSLQKETEARVQSISEVKSSIQSLNNTHTQDIKTIRSEVQSVNSNLTQSITAVQYSLQNVSKLHAQDVTQLQYSIQGVQYSLQTVNSNTNKSLQSVTEKITQIVQGVSPVSVAQSVQYPLKIGDKTYNGSQAVTISQDELLSWKSLQTIFASQGISLSKGKISTTTVEADNLVTYTVYDDN